MKDSNQQKLLVMLQLAQQRLREVSILPEVFAGRSLRIEDCITLELGIDEHGNAIIPIRDVNGELLGLKGRYLQPGKNKYFGIPTENRNPSWLASNLLQATKGLLFIEGELNAMVSYLSLREAEYGIIGLGSAFADIPTWTTQMKLPLFLYFDNDIASNKSAKDWLENAKSLNLSAKRLGSLLGNMDACEYAETCGREALQERWLQLLKL
ncbi:MAG: hypothetical protein ACRCYY_04450 [Trueperaceae bacterium]